MPTCRSPRHVRRTGVFIAPSGYYREDGDPSASNALPLYSVCVAYSAFFFIKLVSGGDHLRKNEE